jgi:hypothetical protein
LDIFDHRLGGISDAIFCDPDLWIEKNISSPDTSIVTGCESAMRTRSMVFIAALPWCLRKQDDEVEIVPAPDQIVAAQLILQLLYHTAHDRLKVD